MTYYGTKKSILGKKKSKICNNTNSILKRKKKQEEVSFKEHLKEEPVGHDPGWYFDNNGNMVYRIC